MTNIIRYIAVLAVTALLLQGCLKDDPFDTPKGGKPTVTIQLKMPGLTSTRATAITMPDICYAIDHLDILVFENRGGEDDRFLYALTPTEIRTYPEDPTLRTFPLGLNESSVLNKLVVIANLEDEVRDLLATYAPDPENTTVTKKTLFDNLIFDEADWRSDYGGLPMWGESEYSTTVTQTTTGGSFGRINMLYAVAQIDVAVNADAGYTEAAGLDNFKMASVAIHGTRMTGYAVPREGSSFSGGKVSFPSIPPGCEINGYSSMGHYSGPGQVDFPLLHAPTFHVAEADSKDSPNDENVFVIISGYYGNSLTETWYRIDLYNHSASGAPSAGKFDMLRGHRYMVNITGVSGPGYSSEAEAIASKVSALSFDIRAWDIMNDTEVNADNRQNYLDVSDNSLTIGRDHTSSLSFTVETDVPGGYEVEITDSPYGNGNALSWIEFRTDSPAGEPTFDVERNYSSGQRTAHVHVNAGRLSKVVTVVQLNTQVLILETSVEEANDEMMFVNFRDGMTDPSVAAEQILVVTWLPEHIDIRVTNTANVAGGVPLDVPIGTTYSGGRAEIPVHPDPMSPDELFGGGGDIFLEKSSLFEFELVGDDSRIRKNVNIRQKSYGVKYDSPDMYYSMISSVTGSFNMAVNTPWNSSVAHTANSGSVTSVSPTSGTGNTSLAPFSFPMRQGTVNTTTVSTTTVTITSIMNYFPPETITINGVWGWVFKSDGLSIEPSTGYENYESDTNGVLYYYVAKEYDRGGDGANVSVVTYNNISTYCQNGGSSSDGNVTVTNWMLPRIVQLYDFAQTWGYNSTLCAQTHLTMDRAGGTTSTNSCGYWSRSKLNDGILGSDPTRQYGISFTHPGELDNLYRMGQSRHVRCTRQLPNI